MSKAQAAATSNRKSSFSAAALVTTKDTLTFRLHPKQLVAFAARQRKFSTGERRAAVSRASCALLALAAIHQRGSPCAILFWLEAV
jgi:inactivated superfamily I helicase